MKGIHYILILFLITLSSFATYENCVSKMPETTFKKENLFLNEIIKGIESTKNIKIGLLSYRRVGKIKSSDEKKSFITDMVSKENFYFLNYDSHDKSFRDLKVNKLEALKNPIPSHQEEFEKEFESILEKNSQFLNRNLQIGFSIYKIKWEVDGNRFITLAVFNDQDFVYDNIISNLINFEIDDILPGKKPTEKDSKSTSDFKRVSLGGRSISQYYMGGVHKGTATVKSWANYRVDCEPGGAGADHCKPYLLSVDTETYCDINLGNCDANYRVIGKREGYNAQGKVNFGLYLTGSLGDSATMTYDGSHFQINGSGNYNNIMKFAGQYSYFASSLPL